MLKKIKAFTLSEILIALTVIGVVASLVLPQLVNGQKAATAQSQYNTAYSLIAKALTDMETDNISTMPEDYMTAGEFYPEFKKYFKISIDCGKYGTTNEEVCISTTSDDSKTPYKDLSGDKLAAGEMDLFDDGAFVLNNSMLVMLENNTNNPNGLLISVDINGKAKNPNRYGYDIFTFEVTKEGLLPLGAPGTTAKWSNDPDKYCNRLGNITYNGATCAYFATTNQDYFKDIYSGH